MYVCVCIKIIVQERQKKMEKGGYLEIEKKIVGPVSS